MSALAACQSVDSWRTSAAHDLRRTPELGLAAARPYASTAREHSRTRTPRESMCALSEATARANSPKLHVSIAHFLAVISVVSAFLLVHFRDGHSLTGHERVVQRRQPERTPVAAFRLYQPLPHYALGGNHSAPPPSAAAIKLKTPSVSMSSTSPAQRPRLFSLWRCDRSDIDAGPEGAHKPLLLHRHASGTVSLVEIRQVPAAIRVQKTRYRRVHCTRSTAILRISKSSTGNPPPGDLIPDSRPVWVQMLQQLPTKMRPYACEVSSVLLRETSMTTSKIENVSTSLWFP
ncbi:hypothetical protein L226DRAFT_331997 [Lentinus tigrinus ALCF2SS1-7]|uniref:uncharacterized protein n=1 Tax=Lentinus tigrinus ALCF2SS1-7 TaxID=1328758 RepID=UPI001165C8A4|nr:hypothetical protein L226DRAFT_331997 [Lentinus tigrinus ALCF2SS1-7]